MIGSGIVLGEMFDCLLSCQRPEFRTSATNADALSAASYGGSYI